MAPGVSRIDDDGGGLVNVAFFVRSAAIARGTVAGPEHFLQYGVSGVDSGVDHGDNSGASHAERLLGVGQAEDAGRGLLDVALAHGCDVVADGCFVVERRGATEQTADRLKQISPAVR